jgi:dTDP-3-amino-3,6-dideoxy-alpha-D-glucopyranose N,N-dimethyltransferase/dTDP-3-amino-3,4,6-trideoxy-alpha-D-glucopyranose N,N-dimethyltransferase
MSSYGSAAEFYDLLYAGEKNYVAEAHYLTSLIRKAHPDARSLLDVGCGTGAHARALTDAGYAVDGVDLEPGFVEIARGRCPEGSFVVGDMTCLDLPGRYDVVTSLFSAIGYARTEEALRATLLGMRSHLDPSGIVLVDPWFEPGQLTDGRIMTVMGESTDLTVCRMSRTVIEGRRSRLEFEYLIGTPSGIERRSEVHELGLFTQEQMERAFLAAGLTVERMPEAHRTRGIYVGRIQGSR